VVSTVVAGGQVIEHTADVPAGPDRLHAGRRRWLRPALLSVAAAVIVSALIYATVDEVQADNRFDGAHRALDATRHHLKLVVADLTVVRGELQAVDGQIGQETAALTQDTIQLQGLEAALASDRANVTDQTSTTHDLQVCLAGVEQGLNALSVGDQPHALRALSAVSGNCSRAVAADG